MTVTVGQRAVELRATGVGYRRIAAELGISVTSVRRLVVPGLAARSRVQSREAKRRRTGMCVRCGAVTRYHGRHGQRVSPLCAGCGAWMNGLMRVGRGPVQAATLAFLTEPRRFCEIRDHLGITDGHAGTHLHRMVALGLIERVRRGVYVAAPVSRAPGREAVSPHKGLGS